MDQFKIMIGTGLFMISVTSLMVKKNADLLILNIIFLHIL